MRFVEKASPTQSLHSQCKGCSMRAENSILSNRPLCKGRILLIDDDQHVLTAYSRALRHAGFFVEAASDGRVATGGLRHKNFDLVISDIDLPGMDGIQILETVRARDSELPVILMTGGADVATAAKAVEHGALRYLMKPVDLTLVCSLAEDAVRLRKLGKLKRAAFELYGAAAAQESRQVDLQARFTNALETLHMAYQPIVCWSERRVVAYEALLRTEEASLVRPNDFLDAAVSLGRIHDVGRRIRDRVARSIEEFRVRGSVYVNLHSKDFDDEELYSTTAPLTKLASSVVLEITERDSLEGIVNIKRRLQKLRDLGYRLAIDDLGAGYAGLSSFASVTPEVVKFDMSLVRDVNKEPTKQKLIRSLAAVCKEMDMLVISEGVESVEERDMLVDLGCDIFQGYLFAKPGKPFPVWHS
jgi:EAL domain-containing protein (putative c-di-GMP-specific phosphodiesterase class I)/ActR/RegA family two-component response regulator